MSKILITDSTTYLNSYICLYALELGLEIKAGLAPNSNPHHITQIQNIHRNYEKEIDSIELDLQDELSLRNALEGCDTVIHSLVEDIDSVPDNPGLLIKTSINKALTLMKICKKMKITRLIFTGDVSTVYCGSSKKEFKDEDWGELEKTGSLQRAFLYIEKSILYLNDEWDKFFDLTILNIGLLLGPSIGRRPEHMSNRFIRNIILGKIDQNFKVKFPIIDVRDAALIHLHVLDKGETFNKRYNTIKGCHWMKEISGILGDEFEQFGFSITGQEIGFFPVVLLRLIDNNSKKILHGYGKDIKISNWKIKEIFKGKYRSLDETLIEMGYDLMDKGIIYFQGKGEENNRDGHYDSRLYNKQERSSLSKKKVLEEENIRLSERRKEENMNFILEKDDDEDEGLNDELEETEQDLNMSATVDPGMHENSGTN